jgi:hypothetical protein
VDVAERHVEMLSLLFGISLCNLHSAIARAVRQPPTLKMLRNCLQPWITRIVPMEKFETVVPFPGCTESRTEINTKGGQHRLDFVLIPDQ